MVYSVKGIEVFVCYCLGVQLGMYFYLCSLGDVDLEEEEWRILYVVLMWVQDELIIICFGDDNCILFYGGFFVYSVGSSYFFEYLLVKLVEYEYFGFYFGYGGGSVLDELLDFE